MKEFCGYDDDDQFFVYVISRYKAFVLAGTWHWSWHATFIIINPYFELFRNHRHLRDSVPEEGSRPINNVDDPDEWEEYISRSLSPLCLFNSF